MSSYAASMPMPLPGFHYRPALVCLCMTEAAAVDDAEH